MKINLTTSYQLCQFFFYLVKCGFLLSLSGNVSADVIDPEKHIIRNGYHNVQMGDDGKTSFYSFTERAKSLRITKLENDIANLPKHVDIYKVCDFMRGGVKAKLIETRSIAFDVAVNNYGYSGSTIACVLKYMYKNQVGTQLIYSKKGSNNSMYIIYVTD